MGQANAARDKLYDLRACNIPQQKAVGYDLSGVITTKTDLRKSNFQDAQFSKAYLHGMLCYAVMMFAAISSLEHVYLIVG